jgi:phytoene dehydrogenase-like protein
MSYDAVIIGAGLGGLSAGAYLSRAGKKVLVLEKMSGPGGRCRTVELMGHRFDIGADYFGKTLLGVFSELGKRKELEPVWFKVLANRGDSSMTIPPGLHTPKDLSRMGMGTKDIGRFGINMGGQILLNRYRKISSYKEVINRVTDNDSLREILNVGAFFSGNEPENMPSHWFNLVFGRTYGYDRPFIPKAGSGRLPELLADVIREAGGGIVYNAQPKKIIIDEGQAKGVLLDGREIEADNVISGTGILQTVHSLAGKEYFPQGFLNTLGYYKEGFCMASVFTVFKRSAKITPGAHLYAMFPKSVGGMFRTLKDGSFPEDNMYVISVPGAAHDTGEEHLAGTIKFLVPKGAIAREAIEAEAGRVMAKMDSLIPGFRGSVVESRLYTPMDYAVNFGFVSSVSPVAESVHYEKMDTKTPVKGLYCVGSTVLPVGGCAASSVLSGRAAARLIIKNGVN